jgi:hypothetical protein
MGSWRLPWEDEAVFGGASDGDVEILDQVFDLVTPVAWMGPQSLTFEDV